MSILKKEKVAKVKKQKKTKKLKNQAGFIKTYPVITVAVLLSLIMGCITAFKFDRNVGLVEIIVTLVLVFVAMLVKNVEFYRVQSFVKDLDKKLAVSDSENLKRFPLPVVLFDKNEKFVWYNELFSKYFIEENLIVGNDVKQFTSGKGIDIISDNKRFECEFGGRGYTAYLSTANYKKGKYYALYFTEDTLLKQYRAKYEKTRPTVLIINIDAVDEYLRDFKESQQTEILSGIENIIENWFSQFNCILRKVGTGKFIVIAERYMFFKMKEDKFSLLSTVRSYTYNDKTVGITLSVGVGSGKNLPECEKSARQALDMALGRGGDQVAIKTEKNEYEFFGGVSKGVEKRTKVMTRKVAAAIAEAVNTSDNVLIMGHRFADLDALGSAAGVAVICQALGKDAKIVMSEKTTLAMPLLNHLKSYGYEDLVIEPEESNNYLSEKTLLIIVDTHRQSFLEYPELFDKVNSTVIIDHHRKTVDHINKAVVFYHETNSSSASEMVTELIQYINFDIEIPQVIAEALLSGITLDTKNFVMRTGVRTFEAAAYLRSMNADTVAVKQLFSNSMQTQKAKSEVVTNAATYKNCAVGVVDFDVDNIRIVASQAADELLNIDGVLASFVLFQTGTTINISARSYGDMNVQIVMEFLGGGGHQTMAAAQLEDETFEGALKRLSVAIDKANETRE